MSFVKLIPGTNYYVFRSIVAAYFCVFLFFLGLGYLIKYDKKHSAFLSVLCVLIAFSFLRFSIQIREGIAVTFLLFAFTILFKEYSAENGTIKLSAGNKALAFLLFAIASSVHGGTAPFLYIYVVSLLLQLLHQHLNYNFSKAYFYLRISTIIIALAFPILYTHFISAYDTSFISKLSNSVITVEVTNGKIAYWVFQGAVIFTIRARVLRYIETVPSSTFKVYLQLLVGVLLQMLYLMIMVFILLRYPGPVVSAFSRLLSIIMGISLLLLAFKTKNSILLGVLMLIIIIEQIRTYTESLLSSNLI
jgi:hypothetical protein